MIRRRPARADVGVTFRKHPLPLLAAVLSAGVLVAGCGSSGDSSSPAATATTTTSTAAAAPATGGVVRVAYRDFAIAPEAITVKAGQKITWTNYDASRHNVNVKPGAPQAYTSADFDKGQSVSFTPSKPGVYHYLCTFHAGSMQGTITVTG